MEVVDQESLGGQVAHGRSGVVHVVAGSAHGAFASTRALIAHLTDTGPFDASAVGAVEDPSRCCRSASSARTT